MGILNKINKAFVAILISVLAMQVLHAEVNQEKLNDNVEKAYISLLQMFNGSQIGTRYVYNEVKGVETANKGQWRAKLNFTYALLLKTNEANRSGCFVLLAHLVVGLIVHGTT